jgi:hypothetical protein
VQVLVLDEATAGADLVQATIRKEFVHSLVTYVYKCLCWTRPGPQWTWCRPPFRKEFVHSFAPYVCCRCWCWTRPRPPGTRCRGHLFERSLCTALYRMCAAGAGAGRGHGRSGPGAGHLLERSLCTVLHHMCAAGAGAGRGHGPPRTWCKGSPFRKEFVHSLAQYVCCRC